MFSFLLGKYIVALLGHRLRCLFSFIKNCSFPKVAISFYLLISNIWEFWLLHIITNSWWWSLLVIFAFLVVVWQWHCGFNLAFPWWLISVKLFCVLFTICWSSFPKCVFSSCLFLIRFSFYYWVVGVFFIYFGYQSLSYRCFQNIFSQYEACFVFEWAGIFKFDEVSFISCFLLWLLCSVI